jgi:glycosyltransferase involved in cell wall biosynthesis
MVPGLVSVVIPAYNRAGLLIAAVDSVLAQTYPAHEVVIVDDGSTDGTEEAVRARFGGQPKVRYFRQKNAGVSAARNRGMKEAAGEFIAFLDSDDAWLPGKLALQLEALRLAPEAGMVWTEMSAVDERGAVLHPRYLRTMYSAYRYFPAPTDLFARELDLPAARAYAGDVFSAMVLGNLVHTSTVLLRRSVQERVGFFDESYRVGEDYKFHLHTCRTGPVAFVDEPTVLYRVGSADALTASKHTLAIARNFVETLENTLREDGARIILPAGVLDDCRADAYSWVGSEYLADGQTARGRGYFLKSLGIRMKRQTLANLAKSFVPEPLARAYRARRRSQVVVPDGLEK